MKKTISVLLILCMIFVMTISSFALDNNLLNSKGTELLNLVGDLLDDVIKKLPDIANHWAKEFIAALTEKGIIGGYPDGTFRPNANIKVTEFTILILKSKDIEVPETSPWYQGAIEKAEDMEIIKQGEYDNLDTRLITRGEMARMIVRALDEKESSGATKFDDDGQIPSSIKEYVKKAVELNIIGGYPDNTFRSEGNATRAEASTMISKMLDIMENGETSSSTQDPTEEEKIEPKVVVKSALDGGEYQAFYIVFVLENLKEVMDEYGKFEFYTECVSEPRYNTKDFWGMDGQYHRIYKKWAKVNSLGKLGGLTKYYYTTEESTEELRPYKEQKLTYRIKLRSEDKDWQWETEKTVTVPFNFDYEKQEIIE